MLDQLAKYNPTPDLLDSDTQEIIYMLKEMASKVPDKSVDLLEQLKFERELLEFPIYQNPSLPKGWYYVIGFKTYGDKINTPYLVLYDLITSDLVVCSINKSKLFSTCNISILDNSSTIGSSNICIFILDL